MASPEEGCGFLSPSGNPNPQNIRELDESEAHEASYCRLGVSTQQWKFLSEKQLYFVTKETGS
jgi:hypothetical protein